MNLPVTIESSLLSPEKYTAIADLAQELSHACAVKQIFRTETEARVSVLDDIHFPTIASKYWQCIREQTVMLEQLATLSFEYRRNEVSIKKYRNQLAGESNEFEIETLQIDIDECLFRRENMKKVADDRAREIEMWSKLKAELDDGSFDVNVVDAHQLISYATQFAKRAAHSNPATMSAGELDNLAGLLQTSLRRCREMNILPELKKNLPSNIIDELGIRA